MIGNGYLVAAARLVRILVVTYVATLLVGFVAVRSFAGLYGEPRELTVVDVSSDTNLRIAIAAQESAGLTCRETPALTDVVLFQPLGDAAVEVLSFDDAVRASRAGEGWIRRYCV
jgi:hypothetical protein